MYRILPVLAKTVMIVFDLRAIDLMKIWRGATTHHSLLSLYSLQSLPLQAWELCNMITRCEDFELIFVKYFRKTFPPFQCDSHGLPMGIQNGGERRGNIPDKSLFTSVWNLRTHLQKPRAHLQKNRTHLQKTNTFAKKTQNTFAKKCYTFAVFLKSLKRRQSWNEGGWIVRDHLQDTFGSFPKWRMILMLVGAEEIIPGWGKEWENSEKVRCCTVPSLPVQTPVPPKHWQYLSMLFAQGIHFIPHSP